MNNYSVVRLVNGTVLVGDAVVAPEDVLLTFPLEIHCKPVTDDTGKLIGEQILLRPCLVMTQETDVVIDTYNVLYINRMDNRLVDTYEDMVKSVYKHTMNYSVVTAKEKEENVVEDMSEEEREYLKEYLNNMLNKPGKDILH